MHAGERVAVVSGGANGIGAAIVDRLVARGHPVASLDLTSPAGVRPGVTEIGCDIGDGDAVASALSRVRSDLGAPAIVVHCAAYQHLAVFDALEPADWDRTFRVNVDGAFHLVRTALPDLRSRGWGTDRVHHVVLLLRPAAGHGALHREQGRAHGIGARPVGRARSRRHHRQRGGPGPHPE
jgi:NAD(P)-dependent dehydrogenase (short-subunit alcohol dehydrogenase family)